MSIRREDCRTLTARIRVRTILEFSHSPNTGVSRKLQIEAQFPKRSYWIGSGGRAAYVAKKDCGVLERCRKDATSPAELRPFTLFFSLFAFSVISKPRYHSHHSLVETKKDRAV